jgi:glucarate dehydratase
LKITDLQTTVILVPNKFELAMSPNLQMGRACTILEISTNEGIVGLGEITGVESKLLIDDIAKPLLLNQDPFKIELLEEKLRTRISNLTTIGGIDMALWDIVGKTLDRPISDLLGGRYREKVEFFAYLHPGYKGVKGVIHDLEIPLGAPVSETSHGEGGRFTPEDMVEWAKWLVNRHGFRVIEWKTGIQSPIIDIETIRLMREEFGPEMPLRIDANGAWTPETALRTLRIMNNYDLRNAEDPTSGLRNLAKIRKSTGVPISTHTSTHGYPESSVLDIANAGLDAAVPDLISSGGIIATKKIVAVAEACGINCWLHCAGDLGISEAARIHFLASTPYIIEPSQTGHNLRTLDDIIKGPPWKYEDGSVPVPNAPGLGVQLDKNKVNKYHKLWVDEASKAGRKYFYDWNKGGEYPDYHRPDWYPKTRRGWKWGMDGRE